MAESAHFWVPKDKTLVRLMLKETASGRMNTLHSMVILSSCRTGRDYTCNGLESSRRILNDYPIKAQACGSQPYLYRRYLEQIPKP